MIKPPPAPYTRSPASIPATVDALEGPARRALLARLDTLVTTLTGQVSLPLDDASDVVAEHVGLEADKLWLAHAILAASLPSDDDMGDLLVRARLGGTWTALLPLITRLADGTRFPAVEVVRGTVTCDVQTTAESGFLSGVQRVVRETTSRWASDHDVEWVGWTKDVTGLQRIAEDGHRRLFGRSHPGEPIGGLPPVVVPWESTHLWVEVITDVRRTSRLLAMAHHSRNEVGVLGYDSIPVTSSATVADGMTSHFARGMAAMRRADRVAMISDAAAAEFSGVMQMGSGRRDPGPDVVAVPLAVEAPVTTDAALAEATAGLVMDGMPMVLVVGSHEPRKNHLAVLHAAELLWREGQRFNLVMVGAGSWGAEGYEQQLGTLLGAGRPVQSIRGLPDTLLGAAYRLAHCTVFPSLNEGFGLPVAESLAVGTPVITSDFGSMRDIAAPHGTALGSLLIDPRNDTSLVDALRTMLVDSATYERLVAETGQHPVRTWDDYAADVWSVLVDGAPPERSETVLPTA